MYANAQLTPQNLQQLDEFLTSPRCPEGTFNVAALRGFLWAVVSSPLVLQEEEWLPLVWEDEQGAGPEFRDADEQAQVLAVIRALHDEASALLLAENFEFPAGYAFDEEATRMQPLIDWCQGLLAGHDWLMDVWDELCTQFDEQSGAEFSLAEQVDNMLNLVSLIAEYPEILADVDEPEALRADLPQMAREMLPLGLQAYARTGRELGALQVED